MSAWLIQLVGSGGLLAILVTMAGESAGLPISSEIVVPLGGALAALGRLLPIVRTYISFPAGISTIGPGWFILATVAGALPWNFGLAYAGLKLGQHYSVVDRYLGPVGIPLAILVVILLAAAWYAGRRYEDDPPAAEPTKEVSA